MKYTVTLFMNRYMQVGEKWENVEAKRPYVFSNWDDVQNLIGYLVEGASGAVKFEIEAVREEA